jgi:hypothetical protein
MSNIHGWYLATPSRIGARDASDRGNLLYWQDFSLISLFTQCWSVDYHSCCINPLTIGNEEYFNKPVLTPSNTIHWNYHIYNILISIWQCMNDLTTIGHIGKPTIRSYLQVTTCRSTIRYSNFLHRSLLVLLTWRSLATGFKWTLEEYLDLQHMAIPEIGFVLVVMWYLRL